MVAHAALPMVLDADALNALAENRRALKKLGKGKGRVLTPHPGEMARLTGKTAAAVNQDREAIAAAAAEDWGAVVVLKGAVTVVTDGKRTFVHDQPDPTLGVGGSGDVLGGAITAFLARGLAPLAAACAGVWVHGRAGALLASEIGESGALAMDIADALPRALRQVLGAR